MSSIGARNASMKSADTKPVAHNELKYLDPVESVSKSNIGECLLGFLHDDHCSAVSEEHRLPARNKSSKESLNSLIFHDIAGAVHR